MKLKIISTITSFFVGAYWVSTVNAVEYYPTLAYSTSAEISNLSLSFSSLDPNDIYFFPNLKNSYSRARTGNTYDINQTIIPADDNFLVNGWGNTDATQPLGNENNGSVGHADTTVDSISTYAYAAQSDRGNAYSADSLGGHWINFYTFNPVTVNVEFDYLLNYEFSSDIEMEVQGEASSQIEARLYEHELTDEQWGTPYDAILRITPSADPATGHISMSFDLTNSQYGRVEILAYSKAAVNANAVPIPGAVWLLGSGMMGLVGFRRLRKKQS